MFSVKSFESTSVDFLLFNSDNGICSRISKLSSSEPELLTKEFELIDKLILTNNIQNEPDFISIAEKFMDWGSEFITKQIIEDTNIHRAREIMSHIEFLHDLLPMNSAYLNKSFFNRDNLINIFKKIQVNFRKNVRDYLKILFNIWTFCEKEIRDSEVFCSTLICVYEFMKSTHSNGFIPELFAYAEHVLIIYLNQINSKINDKLVIHHLLTLVKVVVRDETHAISRLHFWWKLICSFRAELMCSTIFDPCVVPFLANIFGKYISFDSDEKFPYSVYTYNVFTNHAELGPLCNHAMTQLLRLVGDSALPNMEKLSKFDNIKHWHIYVSMLFTEQHLNLLLISFYYWCKSMKLNKSKSTPTEFQLLESIFKCFSERFIKACLIKQQTCCRSDTDEANLTPTYYFMVDKILDLKGRLEQDLKDTNRSAITSFSDSLKVIKSIIDSLQKLGDNTSFLPVGLKLLLRVFYDNLESMNKLVLSDEHGLHKMKCVTWVESSKNIINLIFPKSSLAFSLIMSNDMEMINMYWFRSWFDNNNIHLKLDRNLAVANLQCWFFLSSKLGQRLDRDSFTIYSDDKSSVELTPFTEYLVAPLLFMMEFNDNVMMKDDYEEIWKTWEYLYIDIITKATIIPDFSTLLWCKSICSLLTKMLIKMINLEKASSMKYSIVFNMICRALRLVALRTEDNEKIDKKNPLWLLLKNLCEYFPVFSSDNMKLNLKEVSLNVEDNDGILSDLISTPIGKWAKLKLPFVAKFKCDLESNFDTFLSLITILIFKIGHNKSMMLDIVEMFTPKLGLLSEALVCRKLNNDNYSSRIRSRHTYDENVSQLENFIVQFISRIQNCCSKEKMTMDILTKISSFLVYLFSNENGVFSRSTVQCAINFWNDEIGCVENLEYSIDLLKAIKKLKMSNKMIEIPDSVEKKIKDINISFELISQDSSSLSEEPKIPQFGSLLNKVIATEERGTIGVSDNIVTRTRSSGGISISTEEKVTPVKSIQINNISNQITPTKELSDQITPIKVRSGQVTPSKVTPVKMQSKVKEFSSPTVDVVKRSTRKRTCFDLLRKSSDADYVVIAPQKNKRIRLTDHQKESLIEKRNEYKPIIYSDMDSVSKLSLVSHDSTVSLVSQDSLLNRVDSIENGVITLMETAIPDGVESVEEIDLTLNSSNSVDLDEVITNDDLSLDHVEIENKENFPEDIKDSEQTEKFLTVILDKYPLVDLNQNNQILVSPNAVNDLKITEVIGSTLPVLNEKPIISNLTNPNTVNKSSSASNTNSPVFQRNAFMNYQSPLQGPRKILNPMNSTGSPIPNKISSRAQRFVQLALENQIKKESIPKPPVISAPNTDEPVKPSSIIRHFWSEKKKGARVSFSIPNDDVVEDDECVISNGSESVNTNENLISPTERETIDSISNEILSIEIPKESHSVTGFLSPIPKRTKKSLPQMSELSSDLNNSLNEPQSLEKTRQSLKDIVDQFSPIEDQSHSIVAQTVEHVRQALSIASAENQKEIMKELMSLIITKI